jgi:hypothetical protein
MVRALKNALFFQAHPATVSDDHMIEYFDANYFAGFNQPAGDLQVFIGRIWIT